VRWPSWFARPAVIGDRKIHPNAHVPKYGYYVQHLLTENQAIVLRALKSIAGTMGPDKSWLAKDASITEIVKRTAKFSHAQTELARKAVRNALRALQAKHIIRCWGLADNAGPAPSRRRGDGCFKTCWKVLSWTDTLQAIADDPLVWNPKNRAFFVVGRGKKLVTPEEAGAWKLNAGKAKENPRAWAYSAPSAEDNAGEATPAVPQKRERAGRDLIRAAKDFCSRTPKDAEVTEFATKCRTVAGQYGYTLTDADLIEILVVGFNRRGGRVKYFLDYLRDAEGFTGMYLGSRMQNRESA
jgi:hypothetical protein